MERSQTDPTTPSQPRRGIQLPPIQTTFPPRPQRPQRPRVERAATSIPTTQSAPPAGDAPLSRKASRGGLLGLFGRNKSHRSTFVAPKAAPIHEKQEKELGLGAREEDAEAEVIAERNPFVQDINIIPDLSKTNTSSIKKQPSKSGRGRSFRKESTTWDPPPLFQAYPQAIKHATLPAPVLSADTVLRHNQSRKSNGSDILDNAVGADGGGADNEGHKKKARHSKKHKGPGYDPLIDGEWTQKVYVLVTSGFFLQYSGEGSFDRLPEKILPLGKDSAAFASDAIPGKQWVLHVAQEASESDGSFATQGPSSVFKKMGLFQEARRTASNFLLVIDCPDEMNAWLVAVRKEIESLGGRRYTPDPASSKDNNEAARKLHNKPSQRYLVRRERQLSEQAPKSAVQGEAIPIVPPNPPRKNSGSTEPPGHRKSVDTPSMSNTIASSDHVGLEKLRETPRISYISAGTKTLSTSPGSSPNHSPVRAMFCLVDSEDPHNGSLAQATTSPGFCEMSTHALSPPSTARRKSQDHDASREGSLSRGGSSDGQSSSPPPNFSVPSFSKRYSIMPGLTKTTTPLLARTSNILPPVLDEETNGNLDTPDESPVTARISPKASKSLGNLSAHYSPPPPPPAFNFTAKSNPGDLLSPKSETGVPRRFSSLEYSRGVSPVSALQHFPKSPHPPPTAALPEIPGMNAAALSPGSSRYSMQPMLSPLQEAKNARRPVSMQVRSPPIVRIDQSSFQIVSKYPQPIAESTTSSASSMMPDFPDRMPLEMDIPQPARSAPLPPVPTELEPRRDPSPPTTKSMPAQPTMPPAYRVPPPKVQPLPRLPSIKVSQRGFRGSLEGPWTAERKRSPDIRAN